MIIKKINFVRNNKIKIILVWLKNNNNWKIIISTCINKCFSERWDWCIFCKIFSAENASRFFKVYKNFSVRNFSIGQKPANTSRSWSYLKKIENAFKSYWFGQSSDDHLCRWFSAYLWKNQIFKFQTWLKLIPCLYRTIYEWS